MKQPRKEMKKNTCLTWNQWKKQFCKGHNPSSTQHESTEETRYQPMEKDSQPSTLTIYKSGQRTRQTSRHEEESLLHYTKCLEITMDELKKQIAEMSTRHDHLVQLIGFLAIGILINMEKPDGSNKQENYKTTLANHALLCGLDIPDLWRKSTMSADIIKH